MNKSSNKENLSPSDDEIEETKYHMKTRSKNNASLIFKPIVKTTAAKTGRKRKLLPLTPIKDYAVLLSEDDSSLVNAKNDEDENDDYVEIQASKRAKLTSNPPSMNLLVEEQKQTNQVKKSLSKFENYVKLSKNILQLHCELLKNSVEVQTEKLNKSIKEHHDSLIKQVESYEKSCNKRLDKRTEISKYNDLIDDFKSKLSEIYQFATDNGDDYESELNQLLNKISEVKEDYKSFIFGKKSITFETSETSKNFNPLGTLKEYFFYKSAGLDVKRLVEDYKETSGEDNSNLDIDDGDSNGLLVTENVTIAKNRLNIVNSIQNIKFKVSQSEENYRKFISKIDYDKVVLCIKLLDDSFQCDFKIIDINSQLKKDLICKEFRMKNIDLTSFKTNNQFIFLLGKRVEQKSEADYVLEKYDQEFCLYNRVKFSGIPLAMACNEKYLFVLVEESLESCFIETYNCENLTQLLRSKYVFDFKEKIDHADMFTDDDSYLIMILNKKFCLKFSTVAEISEDKTSKASNNCVEEQIELKLLNNFVFNGLLQNFFVDSLLNLIFIENSDMSYYSLSERRYIKQFIIDDAGYEDKIMVTNDGYLVLFKRDFNLEIY
jgi:hypothetical protein